MSRVPTDHGMTPSLLDRLLDPDSAGTRARAGYGEEQMVESVRRDLEELLNTRQTHEDLPPGLREARASILTYGLPDLISLNAVTAEQRREIGRTIEEVVKQFEPRLRDVKATLTSKNQSDTDRSVHFRLDAKLVVEPCPELTFDGELKLTTGQYELALNKS